MTSFDRYTRVVGVLDRPDNQAINGSSDALSQGTARRENPPPLLPKISFQASLPTLEIAPHRASRHWAKLSGG